MKQITDIMKALSDETRLRIVGLLYDEELCVCDLCEALDLPQTKVSRHLGVLRGAGLVQDRRVAQWIHYRLVEGWWMQLLQTLFDVDEAVQTRSVDMDSLKLWLQNKERSCISHEKVKVAE